MPPTIPKINVAFMVDHQMMRHEYDWISRTIVSLMAAGVGVARLIPDESLDDPRLGLIEPIRYPQGGLPWAFKSGLERAAKALRPKAPRVIHAVGTGAWRPARILASLIDATVALSLWSRSDVKAARRLARHRNIGAFVPASQGLANELAFTVDRELIQVVPIGVHVPTEPRSILDQIEFSVAILLAGRGASHESILAVLNGFSLIATDFPQVMLFADLDSAMTARVWRYAHIHGLHSQFGLIPHIHEHRDLALGASILIKPEALGRCDTFLLEAMVLPTAVVAGRDPFLSALDDEETFLGIEDPTPQAWATALRQILASPQKANEQAYRAREHIARNHAMADQCQALVATYRHIADGGAIARLGAHPVTTG